MGGLLSEKPKVVGRRDDAAAKHIVPYSVYCDPGGERVVMPKNIAGKLKPAGRALRIRLSTKDLKKTPRHNVQRSLVIATIEEFLIVVVSRKDSRRTNGDRDTALDLTVADDERR